MPNGLYRQTCRGKTRNRPIERIHRDEMESNGKPAFSVVYDTRIEFLRTTGTGFAAFGVFGGRACAGQVFFGMPFPAGYMS